MSGNTILALNAGSSSLKFALFEEHTGRALLAGEAQGIDDARGRFAAHDGTGKVLVDDEPERLSQAAAVERIVALLREERLPLPVAIGHRLVHGGSQLRRHCIIDAVVSAQLRAAAAFAPLHVPPALEIVEQMRRTFTGVPQVACLDTAFHATLPDCARILPISRALTDEGIARYGFHGLSCESILYRLGDDRPNRLVVAHLGNGASITAIKAGQSIDTSMGLTPSGGIIMGSRSGDLDPGVLIYLLRERGFDAARLEKLIDHESGLLGISGVSHDMRALHEARQQNIQADLAIEMFCISVAKQIAAMTISLGGIDMLVFAGGIGERDSEAREAICRRLSVIGMKLDAARNRVISGDGHIEAADSSSAIRVVPTEEEAQIARITESLLQSQSN